MSPRGQLPGGGHASDPNVVVSEWPRWPQARAPSKFGSFKAMRSLECMARTVDAFRATFKPKLRRDQVVCFYPGRMKLMKVRIVGKVRKKPEWRGRLAGMVVCPTFHLLKHHMVFRMSDVKAGRTPASPYFMLSNGTGTIRKGYGDYGLYRKGKGGRGAHVNPADSRDHGAAPD